MSDLLLTINGKPHVLRPLDTQPILTDESFTLSWSMDLEGIVSFHDYTPDAIFNSREQLFSLKDGKLYIHHLGAPGVYYDADPHPFFMDVVFNQAKEFTLDSVEWYADVTDPTGSSIFEKTLTHITITSNDQCTGRIAVSDINSALFKHNARKTSTFWTFNAFRDIVNKRGTAFIASIFKDYRPIEENLKNNSAWYGKKLMQGKSFIVRFEYDNLDGNKIALKELGVNITEAFR